MKTVPIAATILCAILCLASCRQKTAADRLIGDFFRENTADKDYRITDISSVDSTAFITDSTLHALTEEALADPVFLRPLAIGIPPTATSKATAAPRRMLYYATVSLRSAEGKTARYTCYMNRQQTAIIGLRRAFGE